MKTAPFSRRATLRAYALLLVMVFTSISLLILSGALTWTSTNNNLVERNIQYYNSAAAAEAATEKILTQLLTDYKRQGESVVYSKLDTYSQSIPTSTESTYWKSFEFSNAQGSKNRIYVTRVHSEIYTPLESEYSGLSGYASRYRVVSNVRQTNTSITNIIATAQQEVQLASIPIFQFAIFYDNEAEFTSAAPLYIRGRVHSNSAIYTGSTSDLEFFSDVTSVGMNGSVPRYGYSSFSGDLIYHGKKDTNVSSLSLPIGTNNTPEAIRQVLKMPTGSESLTSPMGKQRFCNKAELLVLVSNTTVTVAAKTPFASSSNNIPWANASYFVSTNKSFMDQRQNKTMMVTEIDVGKFTTWAATNTQVRSALGTGNPPNVLYVSDFRSMGSSKLPAVRLVNAQTLPSRGLTVATPHSLYTKGHFNQPTSAYIGTTNTTTTKPASLACDAYTLLSDAFDDTKAASSYTTRVPTTKTTVNAAILAGNVVSAAEWSGGVHNLPRLLEHWSGKSYSLNGSLVCLYPSAEATEQFQWPGAYYSAPTRNISFDLNFTDPDKLPPGTPELRTLVRARWQIPPPNNVSYSAY